MFASFPSAADTSGILLQGAGVVLAGRKVLTDISLHLTQKRIGIVGRNGSGKSTLLRLMAGLIAPNEGLVRVDGIDPAQDRKAMLSRLGILFQNPDHQILFPTVAEELAFGLMQMGLTKATAFARVADHLASCGRSHWGKASVSTLSQGQRHWLCLQSVLLMSPNTILLDEPFAGLDLPTQLRLSRSFAGLPHRIITISHDPAAVADMERVLWLDCGSIRADGPPDTVLAAFVGEMQRLGAMDADTDIAH